MRHPDFPAILTNKQPLKLVLQTLEFEPIEFGYKRQFHDVEFTAGESFNSWFLIRKAVATKLSRIPPHEISLFTEIAPIELMAVIYRLWAETYDPKEPFDTTKEPIDSVLLKGKKWIEYRKEVNALIPPLPTIWAEREFLRNALNYIQQQHDWVDVDYDIQFSHVPGQLRINAKNTELYCPARGNLIGEVNISAKALFRKLPKRFISDVVTLQFKGNKLVIYSREFPARWSDKNAE